MGISVKEVVSQRIADSGPKIFDKVVDILAEEIITKRVKQIVEAQTEYEKLEKEFKKLVPDVVSYDGEGKVASENFSKSRIDARSKATKRMEKIKAAIDKALENNDFSGMNNLGNGNDESKKPD